MKILGIRVDRVSKEEVLRKVENSVKSSRKLTIITLNTEMIIQAKSDQSFEAVINSSGLVIPESSGLQIANKFYESKPRGITARSFVVLLSGLKVIFRIKEKSDLELIPGVDLVIDLLELASKQNFKVLLVGGENGVALQASENMKKKFSNLSINGIYGGRRGEDEGRLLSEINNLKPDLIFLAFGHKFQEEWLAKNLNKTSALVGIGVGGTIDYLAGKVVRSPKFVRSTGLEWLFRLVRQPWRLRRQLNLVTFLYNLIIEKSL